MRKDRTPPEELAALEPDTSGRPDESPRPTEDRAIHSPQPRRIIFRRDANIEHRRPGVPYEVDESLAHHYVDATKVANYDDDGG